MAREGSVLLSSPHSLLIGWFCHCPYRAVIVSRREQAKQVWGCIYFIWKVILTQMLIYHWWLLLWVRLSKRGVVPLKEKKKSPKSVNIFLKPDLSFRIRFKLRQDDSVCQCLIKNRDTLRRPEVWTLRGWTQIVLPFLELCSPQDKASGEVLYFLPKRVKLPLGSAGTHSDWQAELTVRSQGNNHWVGPYQS